MCVGNQRGQYVCERQGLSYVYLLPLAILSRAENHRQETRTLTPILGVQSSCKGLRVFHYRALAGHSKLSHRLFVYLERRTPHRDDPLPVP